MCNTITKSCLHQLTKFLQNLNRGHIRLHRSEVNKKLIIKSNRKEFNFYSDTLYKKLEKIPLASKGWGHSKAKGDFFVIKAQEDSVDKPNINFEDINIQKPLIDVLHKNNIKLATSFQSEVIPVIRSQRHVQIAAETGCGKTIAYLLPVIEKLMKEKTNELNMPRGLIIVPNRELAHQIGHVATVLSEAVGLKVKVLVGGGIKRIMLNPEFDDIDILVATPGAASKLSTVGIYKLHHVLYTVFDEADTLFDNSFADRSETLVKRVSKSQFTFVSATLPQKIPDFIVPIVDNLITVKSPRLHRPLLNVSQKFLRLTKSTKPGYILQIAKETKAKLLIFTNKTETCNWLAMFLRENNLKCANINGDMNNNIRIDQWNQFVNDEVNILSATDVGSRGLDTTQVKHVVNYDFPYYASDYIHRVGRTGRLGSVQDCKITNFISSERDVQLVQQIELSVRTNAEIPNVDANIKSQIEKRIIKYIRESG